MEDREDLASLPLPREEESGSDTDVEVTVGQVTVGQVPELVSTSSRAHAAAAERRKAMQDKATQTPAGTLFGVAENLDAIAMEFKRIIDHYSTGTGTTTTASCSDSSSTSHLPEQTHLTPPETLSLTHSSSSETSPQSGPIPVPHPNRGGSGAGTTHGELVVAYNPQVIDPKSGEVASLCREKKTGKLHWLPIGKTSMQAQALCVDPKNRKVCWRPVPEALDQIRAANVQFSASDKRWNDVSPEEHDLGASVVPKKRQAQASLERKFVTKKVRLSATDKARESPENSSSDRTVSPPDAHAPTGAMEAKDSKAESAMKECKLRPVRFTADNIQSKQTSGRSGLDALTFVAFSRIDASNAIKQKTVKNTNAADN
mmetsp:Transcript_13460/g.24363  ORF Transcript_13460/g.24363 Transcript_13460/m.24363 type:complete len:372 (+) Transcript_13460:223-1338(+)|eukprot:CAMPEP_0197541312 /NCGR_PEP_ID=MMETSP1318-20131121/67056_1 /TAXON_ID=552666 /ORGANISM="Partenskyella glossopodia, Strain RCC365" /LENGTH=371 /DNA_ID=CAMNT_0043100473 /DNA_START=207 /DNA_END=1322 /DNA_ORIENTATION=+